MSRFLASTIIVGLLGYAWGAPGNPSSRGTGSTALNISTLDRVIAGSTTKAQLTEVLGKPAQVTNLKDLPNSHQTGELWEYHENGITRLSIVFAQDAPVVTTLVWEVFDGDMERPLKTALGRYSGMKWQPDTVKWINPHAFPSECFLKDDARGIRIEYRIETRKVTSITKWDPSRKLATTPPDEKPPEYCIGGGCSPAMAATEFFKQWPINEYCKVPKLD